MTDSKRESVFRKKPNKLNQARSKSTQRQQPVQQRLSFNSSIPDHSPSPSSPAPSAYSSPRPSIYDAPATLPIELSLTQLRPIAYRIFSKKHGLNLKTSGLQTLADFIGKRFGLEWRGTASLKFMDDVAKLWKQEDRGLFVEKEQLEAIIKEVLDLSQSMMSSRNQSINNAQPNGSTTTDNGGIRQGSLLNMFNSQVAQKSDTIVEGNNNQSDSTLDLIKSFDTNIIAAKLAKQNEISWTDYFKIIDSFSLPPFYYNSRQKNFILKQHGATLLNPASSRLSYFLNRYHLIYDSLIRLEIFQSSSFNKSISLVGKVEDDFLSTVTPINSLLGKEGNAFTIMGLLSVGSNGNYWLQDATGKVELEIESHALPEPGCYIVPGCILIVEGLADLEHFVVTSMRHPPCESRQSFRRNFGYLDFLGSHLIQPQNPKNAKPTRIDRTLEQRLEEKVFLDHRIYFLGCNMFLDKPQTLDSLRKLFTRIKAEVLVDSLTPLAFVFFGPFLSKAFQPTGSSSPYKDGMDMLAQILSEFPELFQSTAKLIFVPGDGDPWESTFSAGAPSSWPSKRIPATLTTRVSRIAPNLVSFSSNPSRLTYLSQELLFVRDNVGARLRRNQVFFPVLDKRLNEIAEQTHKASSSSQTQKHRATVRKSRQTGVIDSDDSDIEEIEELNNELEQVVLDIDTDGSSSSAAAIVKNREMQRLMQESRSKNDASGIIDTVDPETAEARKVVKTLLDQRTLSPFSSNIRPVYWDYEHALNLTPLPTLVCIHFFLFYFIFSIH